MSDTNPETTAAPLDPAVRRTVLRAFSYGLYAIGSRAGDHANMFTANWLTQTSFEPPLVVLSIERDAYSLDLMRQSGHFAISVLRDDQKDIAMQLGKPHKRAPEKLAGLAHESAPSGAPVLLDCLGWADCRITGEHDAGDHLLITAEVVAVEAREGGGEPLVMRPAGFKYAG